jgi:hypothetical protein
MTLHLRYLTLKLRALCWVLRRLKARGRSDFLYTKGWARCAQPSPVSASSSQWVTMPIKLCRIHILTASSTAVLSAIFFVDISSITPSAKRHPWLLSRNVLTHSAGHPVALATASLATGHAALGSVA